MYLPIQVKPVLRRRNFSLGKTTSSGSVSPSDSQFEDDDDDMDEHDDVDDMDEDYDE